MTQYAPRDRRGRGMNAPGHRLPVQDRVNRCLEFGFFLGAQFAERRTTKADRRSLKFAAIFDLLHELAALEDVHRAVENCHFLARLGQIAGAEGAIEVDAGLCHAVGRTADPAIGSPEHEIESDVVGTRDQVNAALVAGVNVDGALQRAGALFDADDAWIVGERIHQLKGNLDAVLRWVVVEYEVDIGGVEHGSVWGGQFSLSWTRIKGRSEKNCTVTHLFCAKGVLNHLTGGRRIGAGNQGFIRVGEILDEPQNILALLVRHRKVFASRTYWNPDCDTSRAQRRHVLLKRVEVDFVVRVKRRDQCAHDA